MYASKENRIIHPHVPVFQLQQLSAHGQVCFIFTSTATLPHKLDYLKANPDSISFNALTFQNKILKDTDS